MLRFVDVWSLRGYLLLQVHAFTCNQLERVEGLSLVIVSWLSIYFVHMTRLTSKRVDCTLLHVFVFPGNLKIRKLKVSIGPQKPVQFTGIFLTFHLPLTKNTLL